MVEYGADSSFREQLEMLAGTGALISVHTSNLANALFLPPGAAVHEILQRNWAWQGAPSCPPRFPACISMSSWPCGVNSRTPLLLLRGYAGVSLQVCIPFHEC